jgi:ABC-type dipeptide/oligopeptide/nickel transport system permease subunit
MLEVLSQDDVRTARALGMAHARLILRQIFPNLVSAVVVLSSVPVGRMITP